MQYLTWQNVTTSRVTHFSPWAHTGNSQTNAQYSWRGFGKTMTPNESGRQKLIRKNSWQQAKHTRPRSFPRVKKKEKKRAPTKTTALGPPTEGISISSSEVSHCGAQKWKPAASLLSWICCCKTVLRLHSCKSKIFAAKWTLILVVVKLIFSLQNCLPSLQLQV